MSAINFRSLDIIQGFKSFDKAQSFFIDDLDPGFYFITGENRVEPKLGANGAGKSTIWDALCWVLFEKTPTNLKAGDIHCWDSKTKTRVALRFDISRTHYLLTRTWNPNKVCLSEDGEPAKVITNEDITALIGFNFESFLYSILISQFSSKFFDLKPAEKMNVFSTVMESSLAQWLNLSNDAKKKREELDGQIFKLDRDIAGLEGQILALTEQDYSEQIEEWEDERKTKTERIKEKIKELKEELDVLEKSSGKRDSKLEKLSDKLDKLLGKKAKDDEILDDLAADKEDAEELKTEINADIRIAEDQKSSLSGLKGNCPTCLQPIKGDHLKKEVKKIDKKLASLAEQLEEASGIAADLDAEISTQEEKVNTYDAQIREVRQEQMKLELEKESLTTKIEDLEEDIEDEEEKLEKNKDKENPYTKLDEERGSKIKKLKSRNSDTEKAVSRLREDHQLYNYWVTGFKDIRFMILSEALVELEIQINNNVMKLGLDGWEIVLAVDKETKGGTIKKGFSVFVKSPHNEKLVPFESWSGGEGQRLRLAGTLGLMDFISDRMGFSSNIEVMDEPTTWLSEEGIDDLLEILYDRTRETGKKIFIIDHRDFHTFGGFDGFIKVVKDEDGSHIEIE